MKKLIFLAALLGTFATHAQKPTEPDSSTVYKEPDESTEVSSATSGAMQMENDGLRMFGNFPLSIYQNGTYSHRFYDEGSTLEFNTGQTFFQKINYSGNMEFIPNYFTNNPSLVLEDDNGYVGVVTADSTEPSFLFHVIPDYKPPVIIEGTGADDVLMGVGRAEQRHLEFGTNRINAHYNNYPTYLYLNSYSGAYAGYRDVVIGYPGNGTNLEVENFSKLGGNNAPAIKMKKLTGTTPATEGQIVQVSHGLNRTKILAVDVVVHRSSGWSELPGFTRGSENEYQVEIDSSNITLWLDNDNSNLITSIPFTVLITYEQ